MANIDRYDLDDEEKDENMPEQLITDFGICMSFIVVTVVLLLGIALELIINYYQNN